MQGHSIRAGTVIIPWGYDVRVLSLDRHPIYKPGRPRRLPIRAGKQFWSSVLPGAAGLAFAGRIISNAAVMEIGAAQAI
jgi:hypothetical protein